MTHREELWFTGPDAHVATQYDNNRNYPWFQYRESFPTRLQRQLRSVADQPDMTQYERATDITRSSKGSQLQLPPVSREEFRYDGEENRERWLRERNLSSLHTEKFKSTHEKEADEQETKEGVDKLWNEFERIDG